MSSYRSQMLRIWLCPFMNFWSFLCFFLFVPLGMETNWSPLAASFRSHPRCLHIHLPYPVSHSSTLARMNMRSPCIDLVIVLNLLSLFQWLVSKPCCCKTWWCFYTGFLFLEHLGLWVFLDYGFMCCNDIRNTEYEVVVIQIGVNKAVLWCCFIFRPPAANTVHFDGRDAFYVLFLNWHYNLPLCVCVCPLSLLNYSLHPDKCPMPVKKCMEKHV